jgi:UDP-N-acetylmuramoylalanine-D-glutamate ligase
MEVSSHALDQKRVVGLKFDGAIFTNITHDHLDYHKTFDNYIKAKKLFFNNLPSTAFAITNSDDRNGMVMLQNCDAKHYSYSLKSNSEKLERDAPTLSETQRTTRQRQLSDQDREFQRKRREFQEDLNARKNEELQQVLEKANKVVKQVAEAEKYDLILQEAVYINPKHDITEKVIKVINSGK